MKFEDLEVGKCYTRYDDAEYLVIYKTDNWFVALKYSYNHYMLHPLVYTKEWLSEDYNHDLHEISDWTLNDYIEEFRYIDEYSLTNK